MSDRHASVVDVIRSEWTKLRTVRSTFWTLSALFAVTVGFSALVCWGTASTWSEVDAVDKATFDPAGVSLAGLTFGQLAVAVLGVMLITSEYSTGGIRSTLVAVPRRTRVIVSKVLVLTGVTLVAGLVTSFVAFFVGQALLSTENIETSLSEPHVLRAVIGGGLYLAASALFGFAIGLVIRNTGGGVTFAVAGLIVLPLLSNVLPGQWGDTVAHYFTSNAGQQVTQVRHTDGALDAWPGFAVFCAWWAVILLIGLVLFRRRDA